MIITLSLTSLCYQCCVFRAHRIAFLPLNVVLPQLYLPTIHITLPSQLTESYKTINATSNLHKVAQHRTRYVQSKKNFSHYIREWNPFFQWSVGAQERKWSSGRFSSVGTNVLNFFQCFLTPVVGQQKGIQSVKCCPKSYPKFLIRGPCPICSNWRRRLAEHKLKVGQR